MKKRQLDAIPATDLELVSGGAKAYQFILDQPTDRGTCFSQARHVASGYGLRLRGNGVMADSDGEHAGVAYYRRGQCHIYVN